ncbi:MAG TPA: hypothetical protein VHB21_24975 [Minicystis sp.]|nr:hypothetical protein [Minicystis sp.]
MHKPLRLISAAAFASLFATLGCSGSSSDTHTFSSGGSGPSTTDGSGGGDQGSGGFTTSTGAAGGLGTGTGGAAGGLPQDTYIYAHTDTTLYRLDPSSPSLGLTTIGDFDCIGSGSGQDSAMTDFAVNGDLQLWGISGYDVHPLTLQGSTVHCEPQIATDSNARFYGLTFAPAGVLDAQKEVLVAGNSAGELWAIDDAGHLTQHGTLGVVPADDGNGNSYDPANVGKPWELSGDILFLANNGSPVGFAMVRDCPNPPETTGCSYVNTLIEIDVPALGSATTQSVLKTIRGQIRQAPGCNDGMGTDYGNMYGIAAWGDKVYGFSRTGNLVQIEIDDGTACLVKAYAGSEFAGAGVTTKAPVITPMPK